MKKEETLRIVKKLPQIILPANKNEMFINWYDEDLRFQDEIPQVFERGYIFLENTFFDINTLNFKSMFKDIAKAYKTTYREIENYFLSFIEDSKNTVVYFEFNNNLLETKYYMKNKLVTMGTLDITKIDNSKANPKLQEALIKMIEEGNDFRQLYAYYSLTLTICCLWYIATTQKTTKYYRQEKQSKFCYEKKEVINPKRNKTISTPIYDMNKIRKVKVEGLIKRRKGWTYSHSFQVHGHYRHYADGKVIFIKPFIKGKGKEEINQIITLNPKED